VTAMTGRQIAYTRQELIVIGGLGGMSTHGPSVRALARDAHPQSW
jgi:hypothetical protein